MDEKESKPRKDLFQKMVEIDPDALSESERDTQAITKRRFMTWREVSTSSRTLGFRIEAIKVFFDTFLFILLVYKVYKINYILIRKHKF